MNYNTLSNGRVNHLRNQPGKTDAKSSRRLLSYVRTSTRNHPDTSRIPTICISGRPYNESREDMTFEGG